MSAAPGQGDLETARREIRAAVSRTDWNAARRCCDQYGRAIVRPEDAAEAREFLEWVRRAACIAREHARSELRALERRGAYASVLTRPASTWEMRG